MVFLLAALSAAAANPPPLRAGQRARASITILQSHRASPETWRPASRPDQREIVRMERDGEQVQLRLTEFQ